VAKKQAAVRLSAGELEIMAMLWEEGALTLAQAHQQFDRYGRPISYPTMQTRLNRMVAKGFLSRDDARPAVYRAAVSRQQVSAGHLGQLVDKVSRQSVAPLVAQLITERPLTADEITELKRLLEEVEKKTR
jgi:predicted transcriptional regulator